MPSTRHIKLASAKKKFDDWRNEHGPRGRLPCNLKQLAFSLARDHELTMVASHLLPYLRYAIAQVILY